MDSNSSTDPNDTPESINHKEVRSILQGFLLNRRNRQQHQSSSSEASESGGSGNGNGGGGGGGNGNEGKAGGGHQSYRDLLRKARSEPNLKVRAGVMKPRPVHPAGVQFSSAGAGGGAGGGGGGGSSGGCGFGGGTAMKRRLQPSAPSGGVGGAGRLPPLLWCHASMPNLRQQLLLHHHQQQLLWQQQQQQQKQQQQQPQQSFEQLMPMSEDPSPFSLLSMAFPPPPLPLPPPPPPPPPPPLLPPLQLRHHLPRPLSRTNSAPLPGLGLGCWRLPASLHFPSGGAANSAAAAAMAAAAAAAAAAAVTAAAAVGNNVGPSELHPDGIERTSSTPVINLPSPIAEESTGPPTGTAIAFDAGMLEHRCRCGGGAQAAVHPECPERLEVVWRHLNDVGLVGRCILARPRRANLEELQLNHAEAYCALHATQPAQRSRLDPALLAQFRAVSLPCGGVGVDEDTVWAETGTPTACRLAVGALLELSRRIVLGDCRNGLALVRPPGHHAGFDHPLGYCYFNSVAIAARSLVRSGQAAKVAIIDWDVHHGNGTQSSFYSDPAVLYISLHRFDDGQFFPGTGGVEEVGQGDARGRNVNIAWQGEAMGDAEYLAAFRTLVLPMLAEFAPNLLLVSAGFDAARGHPNHLGGYRVSPECFAVLTAQLAATNSKLLLALEGGYDLQTLPLCVAACLRVLLGEPPPSLPEEELRRRPNASAVATICRVADVHRPYWGRFLQLLLPDSVQLSVEEATRLFDNLSFV